MEFKEKGQQTKYNIYIVEIDLWGLGEGSS